jgi:ATP-grasp ribosomal peptide maturase
VAAAATVLVLSGPDDPTADSVITELVKLGAPTVRMDIGDFPLWMAMAAWLTNGTWRGELLTADRGVDLAEVGSVYYRRLTRFTFDDMSSADAVFAGAEAQFGLGGVLAALNGVLWVNNPAQVAFAEYKPVQLRIASESGLQVPRTLVTNDHGAAREFATAVGGKVVCKTLSSLVLSENGRPRITYTTPIDPATIDPLSLAATAHLLQEWVPKRYDARVAMVGHRPLSVAIHADNDAARIDWRADYRALSYTPIEPPEHIVVGMVCYLRAFGLEFGVFDFTVTPDGEWIFLECNPSGQWLWLQEHTRLPIAAALAELLAKGSDQ